MTSACLIWLAASAVTADAGYHKPTPDEMKVLRQYLDAARGLDREYDRVSGTAVLAERLAPAEADDGDKKPLGSRDGRLEVAFSRNGAHRLMMSKRFDRKTGAFQPHYQRVLGANPAYAFFLERNPDSGRGKFEYSIRGLGQDNGKADSSLKHYGFNFVDAARGTLHERASDLLSDPSLTIKGIHPVDDEGRRCYKIEFRHDPSRENTVYLTGWLIASPDEGWATKEFHYDAESPRPPLHGRVRYTASQPGRAPRPEQVVVNDGPMTRTFQVDRFEFTPEDDSRCFLAHYGYPESLTLRQRPRATRGQTALWFSLAIGCVTSSVILTRVFGRPPGGVKATFH